MTVKIDPKEVGKRIKSARKAAGFVNYSALAKEIFQDTDKKGRVPVSDETVRLWEAGKIFPPLDKIEQLCERLKIEQEELLFGTRRSEQLRADKPRLAYITDAEAELIITYRQGSAAAQRRILAMAKNLADDDPGDTAEFHLIKPKQG